MNNQTQTNSSGNGSKFVLPAVIAALIVFAAVGFYLYQNNTALPAGDTPSSMTENTSSETSMTEGSYKNGAYNATGTYTTPGGQREVEVELTLTDGAISDITVTPKADDATSQRFQGEFAENYKQMVLGKNIDEVVLTKVSGSSLTPKGFNDALEQIRVEAKS